MIFFVTVFTTLFSILSIKRLDWALLFLIFALPSYLIRFKLGVPMTLLEVMIWVVFLVWFYKNHKEIFSNLKNKLKIGNSKLKIVDYPFKWEMILLLVVSFTAVGVTGFSNEALGIWKAYFFEPIMFFIVVFNVFGRKIVLPERNTALNTGLDLGGVPEFKTSKRPYRSQSSLQDDIRNIIYALAFSALAVSLFAVYQKITGKFIPNEFWAVASQRRVTSFFGYPNAVGLYLEGIILLTFGYLFFVIARIRQQAETKQSRVNTYQEGSGKSQLSSDQPEIATALRLRNDIIKVIFLLTTIIFSLLSIIFAKSVGASLGVAAGLVVFALLISKRMRWTTIVILLIATVGVASYQPTRHKALKYLTLNDFSGQVRRAQWRESKQMLSEDWRWLTGAGLDNYQQTIVPYHQPGIFIKDYDDPNAQKKLVFNEAYRKAHWQPLEIFMYPHNILLNFWTELGLAGVLLFAWIIIKFFCIGFRLLFGVIPAEAGIQAGAQVKNLDPRRSLSSTTIGDEDGRNGSEDNKFNRFLVASLISIMVTIIVHGLVDVPYFKNDLAVMFWLWLVMLSLINLESKITKKA